MDYHGTYQGECNWPWYDGYDISLTEEDIRKNITGPGMA